MKTITTRLFFLPAIFFTFLSLACVQGSVDTISSNTVQSAQIYQIYTIETGKTKTEPVAAFRVGGATGTTLELAAPAGVLYNNQPMPVSAPGNLIGTNYRMKGTDYRMYLKNFQSSHEFSYTDADGKTYVNSINLAPVEISAKEAIDLESENPVTIPLSRAVGANETLTLAIDSIVDDEIPTAGNAAYFNEKRNAVIITPRYWITRRLKPQVDLQIKIKKSGDISNGTALGGSISAIYKAVPVIVNVEQAKKISTNEKIPATKSPGAANTAVQNAATEKSK